MTGDDGSPRLCLVLGAPRSGTTWLQRLLAVSPHVASPQESNLFGGYLAPQQRAWRADVERLEHAVATAGDERRVIGLPTLLEERDLLDAQRLLVERFLARALATKPSAELVVEKTPAHSLCVDVVDRVCPAARFVHIVRDPRDVMASLRDAAAGWGRGWAPADPVAAARLWRRHVEGARQAAALGPDRYHQLRYEDLRADPVGTLAHVRTFLGLPDDPRALVDAEAGAAPAATFAFEPRLHRRMEALGVGEPDGFRGGGRAPLDRRWRRAAEIVLGPTARELGYTSGWDEVSRRARRLWVPPLYAAHGLDGARRRWRRGGEARGW
ncbi:sulfotransferase family protein [Actinomycetospora aeridis]|uniref:Sulfotransferase n=1 Tax=Actinomycetospora aeridis TaxID=3129231 RepID=A0ABU8NB16_9PSEU